jgi:hypothetical protein
MKIINPIYDNAFKYLMDNEQIAKIVLSIILGEKIIALQSKPQETVVYSDNYQGTARYDFKAIIRNTKNEDISALIELQKYKSPNPIVRFREYLADNYSKEETIIDAQGNEKKQAIPIITIYILGYKITKAELLALQIGRTIKDIIWDVPVNEKPDFVELLTHSCIILQVNAKPEKLKHTRLEKFLRLFSQKLQGADPNYVIEVELDKETENDTEITEIVSYLNKATLDEKIVRSLKYEESYEQGLKAIEQELASTKVQVEQERKEKELAEAKAEQERKEKELALNKIKDAVKTMSGQGFENAVIASVFKISEEEVIKIIEK